MSAPRQSVELVLAPADDEAVRAVWRRLAEAGLPSLHDHRSASNRPHLTLVSAPMVTPAQEERLAALVAGRLPMETPWGEVATFGHGPYAVVRLVRPTPELLAFQHDLATVLDLATDPRDDVTSPARWAPHVSFAMRVPVKHRDAVVASVGDPGPHASTGLTWVSARRWDPVTRREWRL